MLHGRSLLFGRIIIICFLFCIASYIGAYIVVKNGRKSYGAAAVFFSHFIHCALYLLVFYAAFAVSAEEAQLLVKNLIYKI